MLTPIIARQFETADSLYWWSCVQCGNKIDQTILVNRLLSQYTLEFS